MFGWNIILKKNKIKDNNLASYEDEFLKIYYNPHFKFKEDKVFYIDDNYVIGLDGIIFNKKSLMEEAKESHWGKTILKLYQEKEKFFDMLRGSFNGFIYEKKSKKIITYTNHLGDRPLFYYNQNDFKIITSDFNNMVEILKLNNFKYSLSENAVKFMLTYGFMLDDSTYINEVKRLMPGSFIRIKENIEVENYFRFGEDEVIKGLKEEEIINEIDRLFNNAVKLQMDKDLEYGYKSVLDISGGLDSRTINYVSKKHGYDNIINLSYSQIDSYEERVTEQLVKDLGFDYIYKALDNASFLKDVDKLVNMNYGLSVYCGITGGAQLLEQINCENLGIQHTGLLGDVADGTFETEPIQREAIYDGNFRFSKVLSDEILPKEVLKNYKNQEMFYFYTRGILAGVSTHFIRRNYLETFSPFADVDFLRFSHRIPLDIRLNNKIFKKWLITKYPEATKVVYDKTMCNISASKFEIFLKKLQLKGWDKLKVTLGLKKEKTNRGMNPYDYWYKNNKELKLFLDSYYKENIKRVEDEKIKALIEEVYEKGITMDKGCAITVLGAIKAYF